LEYRINELTMTLPGSGWEDLSRHRLELPAPDGTRLSLDVVRDAPIARDALAARVDRDLKTHARSQRDFELLVRERFESASLYGERIGFRTSHPEGAIQHEVAYLPLASALLVFVVRGPVKQAEACGQVLREAVGGIQLR
jgi:hypothetical protein